MSAAVSTVLAAAPLASGWVAHTWWMRRRLRAAQRDPLSGLLRRGAFERAATRVLSRGPAVVLVVDLDGFKALNDRFGHVAGDAAIRSVGADLAEVTADEGGVAGRLGGDEFGVVVPVVAPYAVPWLLGGLHDQLTAPTVLGHDAVTLGASIGAAYSGSAPLVGLSGLLRAADEAMYAAKRDGGGWRVSDPDADPGRTVGGRREGRPGAAQAGPGGGWGVLA